MNQNRGNKHPDEKKLTKIVRSCLPLHLEATTTIARAGAVEDSLVLLLLTLISCAMREIVNWLSIAVNSSSAAVTSNHQGQWTVGGGLLGGIKPTPLHIGNIKEGAASTCANLPCWECWCGDPCDGGGPVEIVREPSGGGGASNAVVPLTSNGMKCIWGTAVPSGSVTDCPPSTICKFAPRSAAILWIFFGFTCKYTVHNMLSFKLAKWHANYFIFSLSKNSYVRVTQALTPYKVFIKPFKWNTIGEG